MNKVLRKKIGDKIKDIRTECPKHLTQLQLAERLGVARTTMANWEQGTRDIGVDVLIKICEICDYDFNKLIDDIRPYVYKK